MLYQNRESQKKQKNRERQPESFLLFDSREAPQNDDHHLRNPIAIQQEATEQYQILNRDQQQQSRNDHSLPIIRRHRSLTPRTPNVDHDDAIVLGYPDTQIPRYLDTWILNKFVIR